MSYKKGKANKLNVGDKVQMTPEALEWYVAHLNSNYKRPNADEIDERSYGPVASWLHAKIKNKMPEGKVMGYGASASGPTEDDPETWVELKNQQCIYVELQLAYCKYDTYMHERDLVVIKAKKQKPSRK